MLDVRDQLATLANGAGKEIARLARLEGVDPRDELRYRIWPFLAEIVDVIEASLDEEEAEPATVPVDVVARAVALLLSMANRLGEVLPKDEMDALAARAAQTTEELMSLCDPDELAMYAQQQHEPVDVTFDEESPAENTVIDTTLAELEPALDLSTAPSGQEHVES
jgi:hypothetical protein